MKRDILVKTHINENTARKLKRFKQGFGFENDSDIVRFALRNLFLAYEDKLLQLEAITQRAMPVHHQTNSGPVRVA